MELVVEALETLADHPECVSLVMRLKIAHVLQQEGPRALLLDDAGDIEEERPLSRVEKAVRAAQRILLGDAGDAERLAREAGDQHVVVGDLGDVDLGDVASEDVTAALVVRKVRPVGELSELVPLGGEDALPTRSFERKSAAADACEQIDEPEPRSLRVARDRQSCCAH